jgi:pantetheine-phosphate adenylyltransferase
MKTVVIGGTFDIIHKGHDALFDKAFAEGDHVIIGLTSDAFVKRCKEHWHKIKSVEERLQNLRTHLGERMVRCEIVIIDDAFGVAHKRPDIDAIVVSEETRNNAEKINQERCMNKLQELEIIVIPMVRDEGGKILSSNRIRNSE